MCVATHMSSNAMLCVATHNISLAREGEHAREPYRRKAKALRRPSRELPLRRVSLEAAMEGVPDGIVDGCVAAPRVMLAPAGAADAETISRANATLHHTQSSPHAWAVGRALLATGEEGVRFVGSSMLLAAVRLVVEVQGVSDRSGEAGGAWKSVPVPISERVRTVICVHI